jgi:hypothetical protein
MSRDQLARRWWRAIERLREPSSAAGLAALVALLLPSLAHHAPAIVHLALTALDVDDAARRWHSQLPRLVLEAWPAVRRGA